MPELQLDVVYAVTEKQAVNGKETDRPVDYFTPLPDKRIACLDCRGVGRHYYEQEEFFKEIKEWAVADQMPSKFLLKLATLVAGGTKDE